MFKVDWEKTSYTHVLSQGIVEEMINEVYPNRTLLVHELIAGGCANLNVKILLEGEQTPFILRIYLRDEKAAHIEQKLSLLLKDEVPVPQILYLRERGKSEKIQSYTFAITEYLPGIPLRDLLMSETSFDLSSIMHEVGGILSNIAAHQFDVSGFFDEELNVIPHSQGDDYLAYAKDCLTSKPVMSLLSAEDRLKIYHVLEVFGHLFPNVHQTQLVHADFDPANILVHKIDGYWRVSAVLDWEFAFSGSFLHDVANMLRYAHKMPDAFQYSFLTGLSESGLVLPQHWQVSIHLLNLFSLLDCLKRVDNVDRPNRCADIQALIAHILTELSKEKL